MDGRHERSQSSVLLVTGDQELENEVRRLAARTSVPVEVVPQPHEALLLWQVASVVLVGGDCAAPLARLKPTRRRCVSVVNTGVAHLEVFRNAVDLGAARVLELPTSQDWLGEVLAESAVAEVIGPERGAVLGVISATGGVGGSTLAAATAMLGAERGTSVLVDLDPVGVGIERIIGYDGESITRWATLGTRALSPRALRDSLPQHERVHLVGFGDGAPRLIEASAASSVISACSRAFDLTVLDIPRSLASATREASERCDLVVVLCPQSVAATLAGQRLVMSLGRADGVVMVTRAGPRHVAPEDVADALRAPLLIDVNDQRGLDEALAVGVGPLRSRGSGLQKAAIAILDHLKVGA
ncbi:MAG TPA: septum site-determining protein Ssd [Marmoricola sp.]|nr:septum site-determining protein Ssd [Marmoricola sp.]